MTTLVEERATATPTEGLNRLANIWTPAPYVGPLKVTLHNGRAGNQWDVTCDCIVVENYGMIFPRPDGIAFSMVGHSARVTVERTGYGPYKTLRIIG